MASLLQVIHGKFHYIYLLLLATISLASAQITDTEVKKLPSRPPNEKVSYGSAAQQYAELRLPEGKGPFPVVAILHGGCWTGFAGAEYNAHLATALTQHGYATWNVEYRRAHETGGGWPGTFQDAENGVAALSQAATKHPLDMKRVVILGHSAGGQLALYIGSRLKWPVVSLAGIVDMRAYAHQEWNPCVDGELLVMGGTPEGPPRSLRKSLASRVASSRHPANTGMGRKRFHCSRDSLYRLREAGRSFADHTCARSRPS